MSGDTATVHFTHSSVIWKVTSARSTAQEEGWERGYDTVSVLPIYLALEKVVHSVVEVVAPPAFLVCAAKHEITKVPIMDILFCPILPPVQLFLRMHSEGIK